MMRVLRNNLLLQIVIAIAAGALLGNVLPEVLSRVFQTFNSLFSNFLGFAIPIIIIGLIVPAFGQIGKSAGKLLAITALLAYCSTLFSGFMTLGVSLKVFPMLLANESLVDVAAQGKELLPYFTIGIPAILDVMSALVLSFILGIAIAYNKFTVITGFFEEFQTVVMGLIEKVIIPFLPLFIFGVFLQMTYSGQVYAVLGTFLKIIVVIFILHIFLLTLQYTIAGLVVKRNPLMLMRTMLPAYFTALGTQSSAATIPVSLEQTIKNGVSERIAAFTVPLCATIHLGGSTLKIVACAVALMIIGGDNVDLIEMVGFIFMLGIAMVAAPGVPGGAIMAALAVLSSVLGFDTEQQSLMIALYIAMDSFGTACNVMGDGAIALIVDKISLREGEIAKLE